MALKDIVANIKGQVAATKGSISQGGSSVIGGIKETVGSVGQAFTGGRPVPVSGGFSFGGQAQNQSYLVVALAVAGIAIAWGISRSFTKKRR